MKRQSHGSWRQQGEAPRPGPSTLGLCLPAAWLSPSPRLHQGLGERAREG